MTQAAKSAECSDAIDIGRARLVRRGPGRSIAMSLKTMRDAAGKTQAQVSKASGLSQPEISKLESALSLDDRQVSTLRRYMSALGNELDIVAVSKEGHRIAIEVKSTRALRTGSASVFEQASLLRDTIFAAVRDEPDPTRRRVLAKGATVFDEFYSAFIGGYEEQLDKLWRVARKERGGNAIATVHERRRYDVAVKPGAKHHPIEPNEIEALFERLVADVARRRSTGSEPIVLIDHVLHTIHGKSTLEVPTPNSVQDVELQLRVRDGLSTDNKRSDDRSLVAACFRAVGYEPQLGTRKKAKDYRARAKKQK